MPTKPFGVLMLHGFPCNNHNFEPIEPGMQALDLPYRIPNLRGMGVGNPEALRGLTWHDWLADSHAALEDLLQEVEKAIVIGYSMGGALTIMLAAESSDRMDSLILAAPMMQLASPFAPGRPLGFMIPILKVILKKWKYPPSPLDGYRRLYPWVPIDPLISVVELSSVVWRHMPQVSLPALLLQGTQDEVVTRRGLTLANDCLATVPAQKRMLWVEGVTHDIFFGPGSQAIIEAILAYLRERTGRDDSSHSKAVTPSTLAVSDGTEIQ